MKRSTMIYEIYTTLADIGDLIDRKSCEKLLDRLEEVGMLPPAYIDETIWDRSENQYAMFNEWEPEDESD